MRGRRPRASAGIAWNGFSDERVNIGACDVAGVVQQVAVGVGDGDRAVVDRLGGAAAGQDGERDMRAGFEHWIASAGEPVGCARDNITGLSRPCARTSQRRLQQRSRICSSAAGSSIVVRSPGSRPSASAWIERRSSLPERVFGSSVTKCTRDGRPIAPSCRSTVAITSFSMRRALSGVAMRRRVLAPPRTRAASGPFTAIGDADHRDLGDVRMRLHRLLDLARAEAVAGDVDHVVGAAEDEVVAVVVACPPVERRVDQLARERREIGRDEALVVAPDRASCSPGGSGGTIATHAFLVRRPTSAPSSSRRSLTS